MKFMSQPLEILPPEEKLPAKLEKPWEQMKGEKDSHYSMFLMYRDLGPERSIAKAEAKRNGKPVKASPSGSWAELARDRSWTDRADAWDLHLVEREGELRQSHRERALLKSDRNVLKTLDAIGNVLDTKDIAAVRLELSQIIGLMGKGGAKDLIVEGFKAMQPKKEGVGGRVVMIQFDC